MKRLWAFKWSTISLSWTQDLHSAWQPSASRPQIKTNKSTVGSETASAPAPVPPTRLKSTLLEINYINKISFLFQTSQIIFLMWYGRVFWFCSFLFIHQNRYVSYECAVGDVSEPDTDFKTNTSHAGSRAVTAGDDTDQCVSSQIRKDATRHITYEWA